MYSHYSVNLLDAMGICLNNYNPHISALYYNPHINSYGLMDALDTLIMCPRLVKCQGSVNYLAECKGIYRSSFGKDIEMACNASNKHRYEVYIIWNTL